MDLSCCAVWAGSRWYGSPRVHRSSVARAAGFSAAGAQPVVPSSNPAASEMAPGTGELGRLLGLPADGALRLSGVWVGNATGQWSGGVSTLAPSTPVEASNGAQQLLVEASLDLGKAIGFDNTWLWVQGLQVNTTPDAGVASGSVQGSNSLVAAPPLDRTELYEFAIRKDLLDGQLRLIVGKQSGSTQFANVNRPDGTQDARYEVSSLTSLAFTPVYSMPTLLGRLPGYTNSALGLTMTFQPDALKRRLYVSAGVFDGRGGLGDASEQTGLVPPSLSGPLFSIAEVGGGWVAGVSASQGRLPLGLGRRVGKQWSVARSARSVVSVKWGPGGSMDSSISVCRVFAQTATVAVSMGS